jgi:predicted molibdopterin-dependent oxidoreductase YjgC
LCLKSGLLPMQYYYANDDNKCIEYSVCADSLQDHVVALVVPINERVTEAQVLEQLRSIGKRESLKVGL